MGLALSSRMSAAEGARHHSTRSASSRGTPLGAPRPAWCRPMRRRLAVTRHRGDARASGRACCTPVRILGDETVSVWSVFPRARRSRHSSKIRPSRDAVTLSVAASRRAIPTLLYRRRTAGAYRVRTPWSLRGLKNLGSDATWRPAAKRGHAERQEARNARS